MADNRRPVGDELSLIISQTRSRKYFRSAINRRDAPGVSRLTADGAIAILMAGVNGDHDAEELTAKPTYIKQSEMLQIPAAMFFSSKPDRMAESRDVLGDAEHYRLAALMNVPIKAIVDIYEANLATLDAVKDLVEQWVDPLDGSTDGYPTLSAMVGTKDVDIGTWQSWVIPDVGTHVGWTAQEYEALMDIIWAELALNCDPRDFGRMYQADMTLSGNATVEQPQLSRFRNKLADYTLFSIAALNYTAVENEPYAAWYRAYLVGAGTLHASDEDVARVLSQEHLFTTETGDVAGHAALIQVANTDGGTLYESALALLAAHGLCHLAYDHTFRTNDATSASRATAHVNTLATRTSPEAQKVIAEKPELFIRTTPHPFGFPQGLVVARAMAPTLPLALKIRVNPLPTPPTLARFAFLLAGMDEIVELPMLGPIRHALQEMVRPAREFMVEARAVSWRYSHLYSYYGVPEMVVPASELVQSVDAQLPFVIGYAVTTYEDGGKKTGLAKAQLIPNVVREKKALVETYAHLWNGYYSAVEEKGFKDFVKMILEATPALQIANNAITE